MPGLKDVKDKIGSVKKTAQITKAMNMVASAKLRGAQEKMERFRPYAGKFAEAMRDLSGGMESSDLPLMEVREVKTVEIVVVTSDRGLCGSFNANIIKSAEKLRKQYEAAGKTVSFVAVGKKGAQALKKTGKLRVAFNDIMGSFQMFNAREISQSITEAFLSGESDQVDVVYGKFFSVGVQRPVTEELLPVKPVTAEEGEAKGKAEITGSVGGGLYAPDSFAELLKYPKVLR